VYNGALARAAAQTTAHAAAGEIYPWTAAARAGVILVTALLLIIVPLRSLSHGFTVDSVRCSTPGQAIFDTSNRPGHGAGERAKCKTAGARRLGLAGMGIIAIAGAGALAWWYMPAFVRRIDRSAATRGSGAAT
jgi:hypothetical protein